MDTVYLSIGLGLLYKPLIKLFTDPAELTDWLWFLPRQLLIIYMDLIAL